jgi:hypothetical protein
MSLRMVCLFCVFAVATVNMAFGQTGATGTILGTVTDSTGAVLPNFKVTVTNTATNAAFNTESNSAGDYNAPALDPRHVYGFSADRRVCKNRERIEIRPENYGAEVTLHRSVCHD